MNIAIVHKDTGAIKQTVQCDEAHASLQAAPWGEAYTWMEVTPDIHPNTHVIDLATGKPVLKPQEQPVANVRDQITQGFPSGNRLYPSGPLDQTNMVQVATVGGKLWSMRQDGEWTFDDHTPEQGMAVLRDFVNFKDQLRSPK